MENIILRKFNKEDSKEVSDFIIKSFITFNGKNLNKESIKFFIELYRKENIEDKWLKDYVVIAEINNKIIGVGRAKKNGFITHCYVDKKFMRKGIGSTLMKRLENQIKSEKRNRVLLNSSPYGLKFYEKLGYKSKGIKKIYHGIPLYPMIKKVK